VRDMPLLRYFVFVGGSLLVLLFICDAVLPQVPLPENLTSGSDLPAVRIHSDRKWPERVVFDTNAPSVSPVTVAAAQAISPAMAEASAKIGVRDAFAQLPPAQPQARSVGDEFEYFGRKRFIAAANASAAASSTSKEV